MTVDHQNSGDLKYKPIPGSADPLDDEVTQIDIEKLLRKRDLTDDFKILMMKYDCALTEVRTRLGILNKELSLRNKRNPFEKTIDDSISILNSSISDEVNKYYLTFYLYRIHQKI